ncbi:hypothetical protein C482_08718 [Natrialba chahannaoensis JCM 10990]|uniref:DUF1102 domain-containing protein n=1 Tax=Natrialba chahannaoensis JCM 10990 TaxID=1227492 RepID=M0AQW6_9EURY|nr:hypothetical protein [Natrialba chahannaoensis]ELZ00930.1 hypothetical protein C482_08718 [Natrialba chahannaoensis JCM 10990]
MKLNRRTTLIGLGTIVAGGGAALGTGAFDTVEADRSVNIETAGDDGALLGLEILSETLTGGENADVIEFDLDTLNVNAITTFEAAFEITNNGTNPVTVSIEDDEGENLLGTNGDPMTFDHDSLGSDDTEIELGTEGDDNDQTIALDVIFDIETTDAEAEIGIPEEITIVAESVDE